MWFPAHEYDCSQLNVDDPLPPFMTQRWCQSQWFDEEFNRLFMMEVFRKMVVRRNVPLSAVKMMVQVLYG